MTIEDELFNDLDAHVQSRNRDRDIAIVTYYYGFGGEALPTLETTAEAFEMNNRERVRQVINKAFRDDASGRHFPRLKACARVIATRTVWTMTDLIDRLAGDGFVTTNVSLRGLLNLMEDLQVGGGHELYDHRLARLTRSGLSVTAGRGLVVNIKTADAQRDVLARVRALPGRAGLARSSFWPKAKLKADPDVMRTALLSDPRAWVGRAEDGDLLYSIEDKENALLNLASKAFSVKRRIDLAELATCLANALKTRTPPYSYPTEEEIAEYIASSQMFDVEDGAARFLGEVTEPTDIQQATVQHLKKRKAATHSDLTSVLRDLGYGDAAISKAITSSPVVLVDRSKGRGHYRYRLIGSKVPPQRSRADERYEAFRDRLRKYEDLGTDSAAEVQQRREQETLQAWLFEGKMQEDCAICGRRFNIDSLVTAHKKRRADCSAKERLDPRIVMPLCAFGCDHLYERGWVYVSRGRIMLNAGAALSPDAASIAESLVGRQVPRQWLAGSESYFRRMMT